MERQAAWILRALLGAGLILAAPGLGAAQTFSSGSTGADGPFNPTCAPNPTPCTVTQALPESGVFHFTTVNIPAGVTVRFTRNAANTPAILLAQGAVTINGVVDVSGDSGGSLGRPGRGGPGGFDGGAGADGITTAVGGFGLGPGGGGGGNGQNAGGGGGGYAAAGSGGTVGTPPAAGGAAYGSLALRPILGGSGGGGGGSNLNISNGGGGGGGSGAIVIASSTTITINTSGSLTIRALGGNGSSSSGGSGGGGGGSGGAIRVVAPTISGVGQLRAEGGGAGPFGGAGANGRIRLEATVLTFTGFINPLATTSLPQPVFPGTGQPTLTIASVGGIAAPAAPVGSILAAPDIQLPVGTTNPVEVVLTASNIPPGTAILVTATPQSGARSSATSAGLSGTLASSTASASLTIALTQTSVLTATATFPLVAAVGGGPVYAEGEEVKLVRVASTFGGGSTVTYITASGREVPAERVGSGASRQ